MLQEERFNLILSELADKGAVKVSDLAAKYSTSESTIRRDISELDARNKLKKVFGGAVSAVINIQTVDPTMEDKTSVNVQQKNAIARYAASLIEDNDFVFIDAGSTTALMIDYIENKSAIYMTNGFNHGQQLAARGFRTFITAGMLKSTTQAIVGAEAVNCISMYNFTKCFMGANGIDSKRGITTPDIDEAAVKSTAIEHSAMTYILADNSKFGRVSSVRFSSLDKVHIITDRLTDNKIRNTAAVKEVL